ncbi:hypothetical protein [Streptomyces sp. Tu 3180]|uniref:hypothetical protein n=1 Tax=Streptomyces sp. Tu 3180 TaxID=2682611 RepID=UPI001357ECD3|nr:hypothetical protein [Streptomyces sp. Tu 3180]KAF3470032.1 hypothetical protein GL259_00560 [Streptomyces sp. Tu 3180]
MAEILMSARRQDRPKELLLDRQGVTDCATAVQAATVIRHALGVLFWSGKPGTPNGDGGLLLGGGVSDHEELVVKGCCRRP